MSLYSCRYTNVMWLVGLCLLVQCLIISENKVHGQNAVNKDKKNETTAQQKQDKAPQNLPNKPPVSKQDPPKTLVVPAQSSSLTNSKDKTPPDAGNVTTSSTDGVAGPPHDLSSGTSPETFLSPRKNMSTGAIVRGFYVFVGLGAIVIMYIVVRTIRLRRKKMTVRKYGILTSREDVEMTPLGAEDEDEDTTLFDLNSRKLRP